MTDPTSRIQTLLDGLYGEAAGQEAYARLLSLLDRYRGAIPGARDASLSQRDAMLIAYGDQVTAPGQAPLATLAEFCEAHLAGVVSGVHILPFFPYSSDDGFAVIDYRAVDPALGTWADVARLGSNFRLMFDAVFNHISAESAWFRSFLQGEEPYRDYFITVPRGADLSHVVRPRSLPLLTQVRQEGREVDVWTTFSADQVDLNYGNPSVLLEMLDTLLYYAARGADFIRLDAIAFLWKKPGTRSIHLPETHRVVQLFRAVLDTVAPHVMLVTETNVPHADNISYFGNGRDEATMVYNFALPPLVLHTFHTGDATALAHWAGGLELPSREVTFFNFLASHDGIGLNPAQGILSNDEITALVERVRAYGGLVSYKANPDGSRSPYELNVSYFDALCDPHASEALATQIDRFMAAQAIMLALKGMPGIYFHSLFGSRSWNEGVSQLGHNRAINRQKLERRMLEGHLADPADRRARVFARYRSLLAARATHPAFDPFGEQAVVDMGPHVFAVLRMAPAGTRAPVLCMHNISPKPQPLEADWAKFGLSPNSLLDLVTATPLAPVSHQTLSPYQVVWVTEG